MYSYLEHGIIRDSLVFFFQPIQVPKLNSVYELSTWVEGEGFFFWRLAGLPMVVRVQIFTAERRAILFLIVAKGEIGCFLRCIYRLPHAAGTALNAD